MKVLENTRTATQTEPNRKVTRQKSGKRMNFVKTSDFSYQTNVGPKRFGFIDCFPKGDLLHFKFVQEDERFYIKRIPKGTNRILGYQGLKELTD